MPSNLGARGLLGCTLTDKSIRMHGCAASILRSSRPRMRRPLGLLEQNQWWPLERIREFQWQELRRLLRYAFEKIPILSAQIRAYPI